MLGLLLLIKESLLLIKVDWVALMANVRRLVMHLCCLRPGRERLVGYVNSLMYFCVMPTQAMCLM